MIDIHCHILYGVDDGAASYDESCEMLDVAAGQGITHIIATPHYRKGMFPYHTTEIMAAFERLREEAASLGIGLYLGCEYHADSDMVVNLRSGRILTLAGGDHVLCEFSSSDPYSRMRSRLDELTAVGYVPVIAHAERCELFQKDEGLLDEFRKMGALIQLNADSILGSDGRFIKRTCRRILKNDLADIVASDCHDMSARYNRMGQCYDHIASKYGDKTARKLFYDNPRRILSGTND